MQRFDITTNQAENAFPITDIRKLPPLIPLPEAARLLGIPRASAYRYAQAGTLPVKRFGRRVYVITGEAAGSVRADVIWQGCGMSVEKYGRGWRYRFDLEPDPLTGKRRQATRGGFATKREATTAMNEAMQATRNGRFVRRSARTVRDFLAEWLSARQHSLKPSTWQSYRDYAKSYVEPILGDTKLSELTAQRLNLLYLHLLENGRCKADRNVIMYGYWKSAVASGHEEPKAPALAEIGGVTYDAARKALIRYRAGRLPTPKRDGLSPKTCGMCTQCSRQH